ncbi:MAG: hypothetical protein LBE13_12745 [Bacteroidales bacterium]|jgi:chromosome segregation ATPase|nr:hypothetical protein [Bacteroidales bacterium]
MKQIILFISILFGTLNLYSQTQSDSISVLKKSLEKQSKEIETLSSRISSQDKIIQKQSSSLQKLGQDYNVMNLKIDTISDQIEENKNNITLIDDDLGTKIKRAETSAKDEMSKLDKDVTQNRLYWIIATLLILLLGTVMYIFLKKRIKSNQVDIEGQIRNTKQSLEEKGLKLDNKLVEVLDTQLKLMQEEKRITQAKPTNEIDHSLALKVADEIVRMQKNISKMDGETKGLKPLVKGIERIQNNFASNGYEMVNLLNKDYDERANIDVINFISDENLPLGRKVITAVIKPQVNYNGILIQKAQVDVSQN